MLPRPPAKRPLAHLAVLRLLLVEICAVVLTCSGQLHDDPRPRDADVDSGADADGDAATPDGDGDGDGDDDAAPTPGVDLAVEDLCWSPEAPAVGVAVTLRATVRNRGDHASGEGTIVAFEIDGIRWPTLDSAAPPLEPSASAEAVSAASAVFDEARRYTVTVRADADGALDEADEVNNVHSEQVDVAPTGGCATVAAWSQSEPVVDGDHVTHPLPSFARGSYFYVHTLARGGSDDRRLYSARQNADGTLGSWQLASSDHGGGPHGYAAIDVGGEPFHFRNGHIARYRMTAGGLMEGDVELLEGSVDDAFGGNRYVWDSALYVALPSGSAFVFHLGGFSFTGYAYRQDVFRSGVPVGSSFADTAADFPATRPGRAAAVVPAGGSHCLIFAGENGSDRLWRARVDPEGTLGPWDEVGTLPSGTGNGRGDWFARGPTLFVVRGSAVHAADVGDDDGLGPWEELPSLPEDQVDVTWGDGHLEGNGAGIIGDFVYLTGPSRVFFARLELSRPCGR